MRKGQYRTFKQHLLSTIFKVEDFLSRDCDSQAARRSKSHTETSCSTMRGLNCQHLLLVRVALLLLLVCSEPKASKRRNNHVVSGSSDKKNVGGVSQTEGGRTTKRTEKTSAKRHEKYFSIASELKKRTRASIEDRTLVSYNLSTIDQLTITSLVYNPTSHTSTWVDKLFGT